MASSSFYSYATLIASSSQTIQGSRPEYDITSLANQFAFKINNETYSDALGNAADTSFSPFVSFSAYQLADMPVVSDEVGYSDQDGDKFKELSFSNIKLSWFAGEQPVTSFSLQRSPCSLYLSYSGPIKLIISADVKVSSQFGDPTYQNYLNVSKEYILNIKKTVCGLRPYDSQSTAVKPDPNDGGGGKDDFNTILGFSPNPPDGYDRFPTTGFANASFTLKMLGRQSDYEFKPTSGSVVIDEKGVVTFKSRPYSTVTLTATPKEGDKTPITYQFTLKKWFVPQAIMVNYSSGACGSYSKIPLRADFTNSPRKDAPADWDWRKAPKNHSIRSTAGNSLTGEWGQASLYDGAGWKSSDNTQVESGYWTSESAETDYQWIADITTGNITAYQRVTKLANLACVYVY